MIVFTTDGLDGSSLVLNEHHVLDSMLGDGGKYTDMLVMMQCLGRARMVWCGMVPLLPPVSVFCH
jgi:hypothetical protein